MKQRKDSKAKRAALCTLCLLCTILISVPGCSKKDQQENSEGDSGSSSASQASSTTAKNFFTTTGTAGDATSGVTGETTASVDVSSTDTGDTVEETIETKAPEAFVYDYLNDLPDMDISNKTLTFLSDYQFEQDDLLLAKYGVTVKAIYVDPSTLLTRYVAMVNSGNCPDVYFNDYRTQLITNKYVQAWDPYIDFSSSIWQGYNRDMFAIDGTHYYLNFESDPEGFMLYNKELFDEYSVADPDEQFKQGNWNWDTQLDAVKALTVDDDHDGVPNIYGVGSGFVAYPWMVTSGTEYATINNGVAINKMADSNLARAANAFMSICATGGYYLGSDDFSKFKNGEIAMFMSLGANLLYDTDVQNGIKSGRYWFTALPKDPKSTENFCNGSTQGFYLPADSQNIPAAVAWATVQRFKFQNPYYIQSARDNTIQKGTWTADMYAQQDAIKSKMTVVQDTWNMMGSDMLKVWTDTNGEMIKQKSWAQVVSEYSPKVDAIVEEVNSAK